MLPKLAIYPKNYSRGIPLEYKNRFVIHPRTSALHNHSRCTMLRQACRIWAFRSHNPICSNDVLSTPMLIHQFLTVRSLNQIRESSSFLSLSTLRFDSRERLVNKHGGYHPPAKCLQSKCCSSLGFDKVVATHTATTEVE